MDKKTQKHIINALRRGTITWPSRHECLKKAKVRLKVGTYKNGKDKLKDFYKCGTCGELFDLKEVQVDHIDEVGQFKGDFHEYVSKMYCGIDNLQVLCVECHLKKTSRFNGTIRFKRKKS